jgi:hypothetical protein
VQSCYLLNEHSILEKSQFAKITDAVANKQEKVLTAYENSFKDFSKNLI